VSLKLLHQTPNLFAILFRISIPFIRVESKSQILKAILGLGNLQRKNGEVKGIRAVVFKQGRGVTMSLFDCSLPSSCFHRRSGQKRESWNDSCLLSVGTLASPHEPTK
jgi:hypothetical protein